MRVRTREEREREEGFGGLIGGGGGAGDHATVLGDDSVEVDMGGNVRVGACEREQRLIQLGDLGFVSRDGRHVTEVERAGKKEILADFGDPGSDGGQHEVRL